MLSSSTTQELRVLIKEHGAKKVTAAIDQTTESMGRANAAQDKHEKGSAAMGKNATANFAKMSQGLGGLVHVYATVAANVFALSSAFMVLSNAANVDIMVDAAEHLSASTGISYANVAKNMKNVTQGALSMQEALRSASIGVSSGLSGKQMIEITDIATKAANALGRSVPEAINRMTQAVVKNEPELVDEYGIILRVDSAMKEYAATLGKAKSELTSFDKQMAIHAQLVTQGQTKFGGVDAQVNAYNKLGAAFSEMSQNVLSFINVALEPLANMFAENAGLLAGIAAIFAKGIFARAIPEVQHMTENLKAQRAEYKEMIDARTAQLDVIGAHGVELDFSKKSQPQMKKEFRNQIKNLDFDTLSEHFGDATAEGIKSGSKKALDKVSTIDFGKSGLFKELDALQDLATEGNIEARENLKLKGLTVTQAQKLVTAQKIYVGDITRAQIGTDKQNNALSEQLRKFQTITLELQKQRLIAKDLRASAFSTGASGGFMGGGLAAANTGIKEQRGLGNTVSKLSAGAARVAGIFGNITGLLGSIMSLVSGWGIALFVVSQVALPISDAIGLTSKAAREAMDSIDETAEAMTTLQESASKLDSKEIESLEGWLSKTTATANNLTEQIDKIGVSIDALSGLATEGYLSAVFSFDGTDLENGIEKVKEQITNLRAKQGFGTDDIKVGIELQNIVKAQKGLRDLKETQTGINKELKKSNISAEYKGRLESALIKNLKYQEDYYKKIATATKETVADIEKKIQLERESQAIISKSKNAIESIAKAEADSRNKFAKSSPYFKTLADLDAIKESIKIAGGDTAKLNALALEYNKLTGESAIIGDTLEASLTARIEKATKLNTAALNAKNDELRVQQKLSLIEERIANGDNSALLEKRVINNDILDIAVKTLQAEVAEQIAMVDANTTLAQRSSIATAILNKKAQINLLTTKNEVANRAITKQYNEQYDLLSARVNILNSEKSIIESQIQSAKLQGNTALQYELERAKAKKDIEKNVATIAKIEADTVKHSEKKLENDAKISLINQQNVVIQQKVNKEFSETVRLANELKDTLKIDQIKLDIDMSVLEGQLAKLEGDSIQMFDKRSAKEGEIYLKKLSKLNKTIEQTRAINTTTELEAQEKALTIAEAQRDILIEQVDNAERLKQVEEERFKLQKKNVVNNPEQFTKLLGKEFANVSKEFSDSLVDPVTLAADSMLRVMDTATDTLVDAIFAGENVGKAIGDAVLQTVNDITSEITKDVLKDLTRKMLANIPGLANSLETAAEKRAREDAEKQQAQVDLQKQIEINTRCKQGSTGNFSTPELGSNFSFGDATNGFGIGDINSVDLSMTEDLGAGTIGTWESVISGNSIMEDGIAASTSNFGMINETFGEGLSQIGTNMSLLGSAGGIGGAVASTVGSASGGWISTLGSLASAIFMANGGITNSLSRYANGTITDGPELAMIGDNSSGKEAVVPLPSGENIPVEFTGEQSGGDTIINNNINIMGTDTNNRDAVRRSAGQVAQAAGNATNRAMSRNG